MSQLEEKINVIAEYLAENFSECRVTAEPFLEASPIYSFKIRNARSFNLDIVRPLLEDHNVLPTHVRRLLERDNVANELQRCGRNRYYWNPSI